jgi:hypothetical protein
MKECWDMSDWKQLCRGAEGLVLDVDSVDVIQTDARRHRIIISETADTYQLTGVVVRSSTLNDLPDASLRAWRRNRTTELVGFKIDQKGRLVGTAWVPKTGLRREEFLMYVRHVAAECDLFEYHLTGNDRE